MTDPEILAAEPVEARDGRQRAAQVRGDALLEQVLAALHQALPGRTLKVEGSTVTVVGGADGDVTVQLTPLFALVGFRGARLSALASLPAAELARQLAERAARFANDELVVFEGAETDGLLRTVVIAVRDGRLHGVVEDGQLPSSEPARAPRLYSCQGSWSRPATRDEEKWIARATGGLRGKLKRKLVAKVFKRLGATLERSVMGRASELPAKPRPNPGDRALAPKDE